MEKKYPLSLFIAGFITNIFGRFFFLFFPAVILLFIGIWVKVCLMLGLALLALDIALSFIEQLILRNVTLNSDNPNFAEFQDAMLSENWRDNIKNIIEGKISENQDDDEQDGD